MNLDPEWIIAGAVISMIILFIDFWIQSFRNEREDEQRRK